MDSVLSVHPFNPCEAGGGICLSTRQPKLFVLGNADLWI